MPGPVGSNNVILFRELSVSLARPWRYMHFCAGCYALRLRGLSNGSIAKHCQTVLPWDVDFLDPPW